MKRILLFIAPAAALLAGATLARPEKMGLDDAPAPVQAALGRLGAGDTVTAVRKSTRGDIAVYQAAFRKDDAACSATMSEAGEVMELEQAVELSKLPDAVRAAIAKKYPNGKIGKAESITLQYYDVEVTVDGKTRELEILACGQVKDDDAEDDDGDEDEDEDEDEDDDEDDD
jgi:hypothetical protein